MPKGIYQRTDDHRLAMSLTHKGKALSIDTRLKMSESRKGIRNNGNFRAGHRPWNAGLTKEDPRIQKQILSIISSPLSRRGKLFPNWGGEKQEETRRKISAANKGSGHPHTDESKRKLSTSMIGRLKSEDHRKKLSESLKGRKHSPTRIQAIIDGLTKSRKKPRAMTKPEKLVLGILQILFPSGSPFQFAGDRKFWIKMANGRYRNPDFVCESNKKIIEVFGRYWHRNDKTDEVISQYAECGWKCLIVWDDEIAGANDRILKFAQ